MLKVQNIDVYYGNIQALKGLSLEVNEKELHNDIVVFELLNRTME